jgi:hypothetical protein
MGTTHVPLVLFVLVQPNGFLDAVSYADATPLLNFSDHPSKSCILLSLLPLSESGVAPLIRQQYPTREGG